MHDIMLHDPTPVTDDPLVQFVREIQGRRASREPPPRGWRLTPAVIVILTCEAIGAVLAALLFRS